MKGVSEGGRQSGRENKMRMIASEHLDVMSEPSSTFPYAAVRESPNADEMFNLQNQYLVVDNID